MKFSVHKPEDVFAIYVDSKGHEHAQPVGDMVDAGTLIDPDTDDDMEIVRVEVRLSD